MEVFITEKEEVSENYIGKHFEFGQLSNSQSSTVALIFNTDWESLEKHDKKIRNQVIDELLDWAKENNYEAYVSYEIAYVDEPTDEDKYFAIDYDELKQKLNDMKGERE